MDPLHPLSCDTWIGDELAEVSSEDKVASALNGDIGGSLVLYVF